MTATENEILSGLKELEQKVGQIQSGAGKPDLQTTFSRLDELTRQLPSSTDPTLLHYLYKKSYEKARLYLEGREAENAAGNCRHS